MKEIIINELNTRSVELNFSEATITGVLEQDFEKIGHNLSKEFNKQLFDYFKKGYIYCLPVGGTIDVTELRDIFNKIIENE